MLITSDKTIPLRFSPAELENLRLLCLKSQSVLAAQGEDKKPEEPPAEDKLGRLLLSLVDQPLTEKIKQPTPLD